MVLGQLKNACMCIKRGRGRRALRLYATSVPARRLTPINRTALNADSNNSTVPSQKPSAAPRFNPASLLSSVDSYQSLLCGTLKQAEIRQKVRERGTWPLHIINRICAHLDKPSLANLTLTCRRFFSPARTARWTTFHVSSFITPKIQFLLNFMHKSRVPFVPAATASGNWTPFYQAPTPPLPRLWDHIRIVMVHQAAETEQISMLILVLLLSPFVHTLTLFYDPTPTPDESAQRHWQVVHSQLSGKHQQHITTLNIAVTSSKMRQLDLTTMLRILPRVRVLRIDAVQARPDLNVTLDPVRLPRVKSQDQPMFEMLENVELSLPRRSDTYDAVFELLLSCPNIKMLRLSCPCLSRRKRMLLPKDFVRCLSGTSLRVLHLVNLALESSDLLPCLTALEELVFAAMGANLMDLAAALWV